MNSGILLLHKPTSISSARVLTPLKRLFSPAKIGHTGTLDPFADGLLVVLVGHATRLSELFLQLDKRYTCRMRLGEETDTLDTEGVVVERAPLVPTEALQGAVPRFVGPISQVPPQYSALKVGGRRAYALARAGKHVELASRRVTVYDLVVRAVGEAEVDADVHCSSGTYVRALVRDVAREAGTRAYCGALRRTAVGPFTLEKACTVEELVTAEDPSAYLIPISEAVDRLGCCTRVVADERQSRAVGYGKPPLTVFSPSELLSNERLLLVEDEKGRAIALLERDAAAWRYRAVFGGAR